MSDTWEGRFKEVQQQAERDKARIERLTSALANIAMASSDPKAVATAESTLK